MTTYVLDSDIFSHFLRHHPVVRAKVDAMSASGTPLVLSIFTVEEAWDGWQDAIRKAKTTEAFARGYDRLVETIDELSDWTVVSGGLGAWQRYRDLKKQRLNVRANDLKIGAIALELAATVVTANQRDFSRIPGVKIENWLD